MTPRLRRLALLAALGLAGCTTEGVGPPPSILPTADAVTRSTLQNGRFIELIGPRRQFAAPFLGVPGTNYYTLRSWIDTRNGDQRTQLYVEDSYVGAKRGYTTAHNGDGADVKFVAISENEIGCEQGCSYAEEFAADLPPPLLDANRQGLTIVFAAKSGPELTIAVPGDLIEKQLAALAAAQPQRAAVAGTPAPALPR